MNFGASSSSKQQTPQKRKREDSEDFFVDRDQMTRILNRFYQYVVFCPGNL